MLETLGILMVVQGVGGVINNWVGGGKSWFLVNHLPFLGGWQIPASIVVLLAGLVVTDHGTKIRKRAAALSGARRRP